MTATETVTSTTTNGVASRRATKDIFVTPDSKSESVSLISPRRERSWCNAAMHLWNELQAINTTLGEENWTPTSVRAVSRPAAHVPVLKIPVANVRSARTATKAVSGAKKKRPGRPAGVKNGASLSGHILGILESGAKLPTRDIIEHLGTLGTDERHVNRTLFAMSKSKRLKRTGRKGAFNYQLPA